MYDNEVLDGSMVVDKNEAKKLLKSHGYKLANNNIESFVSLKNINKVYPNGVQAVYDFNLDIEKNEFIVLVGPSGCGKSTTLRMVAGLEDISSGYLYIDKIFSNFLESKNRDISMVFQSYALYPQMTVYDNIAFPLQVRKFDLPKKDLIILKNHHIITALSEKAEKVIDGLIESKDKTINKGKPYAYLATKLGIIEAAAKDIMSYKFIDLEDLYAKRDAIIDRCNAMIDAENEKLAAQGYEINSNFELVKDGEVVFAKQKLSKDEIKNKVFQAANILDLGPYLDRRPKELSGGQMQRVALGRAIVRNAKLFLMDEPLSNLDAKLRVAMRSEIVRLHERINATTIYVTHDQTEAMTMASRIVIMSKGWVQQVGKPQEVYDHPNNIFVATFIGSPAMNIVDATLKGNKLVFDNGYEVELKEDFTKIHDDFYKAKIADCEKMLESIDSSKEEEALSYYAELKALTHEFANNKEAILELLNKILDVAKGINKEKTENLINSINQAIEFTTNAETLTKDVQKTYDLVEKFLLFRETLSTADLAKLHSAQVFSKDNNKKEVETLSYQKRKHEFFWDRWAKKHEAKKIQKDAVANVIKGDPVEYIQNLIISFKEALNGTHTVKVGIRPEHIHIDEEYLNKNKSKAFEVNADVVELMGSELLLHTKWNNTEFVAKISTGTVVKAHTLVKLSMDIDKIHVFDINSGDTLI